MYERFSDQARRAMQFANHSTDPNAGFTRDFESLTMTFIALREIEAGEEITIDYGSPVWWDDFEVQPHQPC